MQMNEVFRQFSIGLATVVEAVPRFRCSEKNATVEGVMGAGIDLDLDGEACRTTGFGETTARLGRSPVVPLADEDQ